MIPVFPPLSEWKSLVFDFDVEFCHQNSESSKNWWYHWIRLALLRRNHSITFFNFKPIIEPSSEVEMSNFHSFDDPPNQVSTGPNAFQEKKGREGKTRMSQLLWKKNRDTGVTCTESYVGNRCPNEQFSLWKLCYLLTVRNKGRDPGHKSHFRFWQCSY